MHMERIYYNERGRPAFAFGTADFLVRHMNLGGPLSTALATASKRLFFFLSVLRSGTRNENILDQGTALMSFYLLL